MAFSLETATLNGLPNNIGKPGSFSGAPALSYPALIHLHGLGGVGDTLPQALTADGVQPLSEINAGNFNRDVDGGDWQFVVFGPVLPSGDWTNASVTQAIDGVINNATTYKIDISQIYLDGLSLGSIGCHFVMTHWPAYFRYRTLKGIFAVSGCNIDFTTEQAQYCVDRGLSVLRGWYAFDDFSIGVQGAAGMAAQRDLINSLQADYYELHDIYRIFNYSTESGGPFEVGEIITWDGGTGTGRLIRLTDNGTTGKMWVTYLTGSAPVNADSLSGGTSSATALISSVPASVGHNSTAWGTPYADHSNSPYTIYHEIELLNTGGSDQLIMSADGVATADIVFKSDQKVVLSADGVATADLAIKVAQKITLSADGISAADIILTNAGISPIIQGGIIKGNLLI